LPGLTTGKTPKKLLASHCPALILLIWHQRDLAVTAGKVSLEVCLSALEFKATLSSVTANLGMTCLTSQTKMNVLPIFILSATAELLLACHYHSDLFSVPATWQNLGS
jgi:hypothetical protein